MNISPAEAEDALNAIHVMMKKTRHALSDSGAYKFLVVWGVVWLLGFLGSHFLPAENASYSWLILDILGGILSAIIGIRMGRGVRSPSFTTTGKRIGTFWLLLFLYCAAAIAVITPIDGKQLAMIIILFVTIGWVAMGLLLSFASVWWGLALSVLALSAYFIFPSAFYLVMAFLGGGGMIALGLYIRSRW